MMRSSVVRLLTLSIFLPLCCLSSRTLRASTPTCNFDEFNWDWAIPAGATPTYLPWRINPTNWPTNFESYVRRAPLLWNTYASPRIQFKNVGFAWDETYTQMKRDGTSTVLYYEGTFCEFYGAAPPCVSDKAAATWTWNAPNSYNLTEFDIVFFSRTDSGAIDWNEEIMQAVATHEFGHALGLQHTISADTVMITPYGLTANWPLLSWNDVNCIRSGDDVQTGYGYQTRNIGAYLSLDEGASWYEASNAVPGLPEIHVAPAVAGNEAASGEDEAYLVAWTDSQDYIRTRLGEGLSYTVHSDVIHGCYDCRSYYPLAATYGQFKWMIAWIGARDNRLYVSYSTTGTTWYTYEASAIVSSSIDFIGAPGLAYNATTGTFLVAAVGQYYPPERSIWIFSSSNGYTWGLAAYDPNWLENRAWFLDVSCNEGTSRCVLAYTDYMDPLDLRFRDLFYSTSGWALSSYQGAVGGSSAESWFGAEVAHRTYGNVGGTQTAVFTWSTDAFTPLNYAVQRQAQACSSCVWSYGTTVDYPTPAIGRPTVASGEYWNEHLLYHAIDP